MRRMLYHYTTVIYIPFSLPAPARTIFQFPPSPLCHVFSKTYLRYIMFLMFPHGLAYYCIFSSSYGRWGRSRGKQLSTHLKIISLPAKFSWLLTQTDNHDLCRFMQYSIEWLLNGKKKKTTTKLLYILEYETMKLLEPLAEGKACPAAAWWSLGVDGRRPRVHGKKKTEKTGVGIYIYEYYARKRYTDWLVRVLLIIRV